MLRVLEILRFLFTPSPRTAFQGPFIRSGSGRAARWILERQSPKVKQVQDDEVGDCLPSLSASSAPLRESILHAEARRTQRVCSWIKAVRVAQRRDTSSAYAPALNLRAIPV